MAGCPFLATPRQAVDSWHGRSHEFGSAVLGAWAIWKTLLRKDVCLEIFSICFGGMILWLFFGTQHVHVYICSPFFNPLLIVNRIPFWEYSTPQWVLEWFDPLNSASGGKGLYGYGMVWHFFNGIKVAPLTRAGHRWFYLFVSGVLGATLRLREGTPAKKQIEQQFTVMSGFSIPFIFFWGLPNIVINHD